MTDLLAVNLRIRGESSWRIQSTPSQLQDAAEFITLAIHSSVFANRDIDFACISREEAPTNFSLILPPNSVTEHDRLFLTEDVAEELFGPGHTSPKWRSWLGRNLAGDDSARAGSAEQGDR